MSKSPSKKIPPEIRSLGENLGASIKQAHELMERFSTIMAQVKFKNPIRPRKVIGTVETARGVRLTKGNVLALSEYLRSKGFDANGLTEDPRKSKDDNLIFARLEVITDKGRRVAQLGDVIILPNTTVGTGKRERPAKPYIIKDADFSGFIR